MSITARASLILALVLMSVSLTKADLTTTFAGRGGGAAGACSFMLDFSFACNSAYVALLPAD